MKQVIVFCLLIVTCGTDTAMATVIRENWTIDGFVKGITSQIVDLPFIRAWAYAEAIDRYCFPEKSYANDVGVGLEETAKSQDRYSPGMLASAERDAADHLRGEYLACAPAMKFVERTVTQIPELANKFQLLMRQLADAKADAARAAH